MSTRRSRPLLPWLLATMLAVAAFCLWRGLEAGSAAPGQAAVDGGILGGFIGGAFIGLVAWLPLYGAVIRRLDRSMGLLCLQTLVFTGMASHTAALIIRAFL